MHNCLCPFDGGKNTDEQFDAIDQSNSMFIIQADLRFLFESFVFTSLVPESTRIFFSIEHFFETFVFFLFEDLAFLTDQRCEPSGERSVCDD